ncbi:MAG TPA: hypothetical protein VGK45_07405 [Thermoanaerobaculia bacterium]
MSDAPLGRYHFLAWARRGIGAGITNPPGPPPSRATLSVELSLSVDAGTPTPISRSVELFGPGDVIGLDPRHVIKTEPRDSTVNFEPNYLCGIEFDSPDLPWLFTPAAPVGDLLQPWLVLIALKPDEFSLPSIAPQPLPAIDVLKIAALPDLADSWNWAHVQVSGDAALSDALANAPGNVISRLLCPRRLDAETSYTAFLVPAFEIGRQAGLGLDVTTLHTSDPAWTKATAAPLRLPIYYQFQFHTSDAGDFESLVRALTPTVLPAEVGQRLLDVSESTPRVHPAGPPPLGLEGALKSLSTEPTAWNDPGKSGWQTDVETFINHPDASFNPADPDPVVAPPIYGRWHAAVQAVDRTAAGWVNDLNLDPRDRSAGGMGTQVVQEERTALMASAWQQVDGVRKANDLLRQAQLARAALQQIHRQRFQPALPETLVALTAPLHAKLLASPRTILATVRASRVPERMLSGAFRRVTRPRRRRGPTPAARPALLTRVSSGEVAVVPPPQPPAGLVSIDSVTQSSVPAWVIDLVKYRSLIVLAVVLLFLLLIGVGGILGGVVAVGAGVALWSWWKNLLQQAQVATALQPENFTAAAVASVPPNAGFGLTAPGVAPAAGASGGTDSAAAAAFRSATANLFTAFADTPADPPQPPALALAALRTTLMTRLDPATTVPRRVQSLLTFSSRLSWKAADPLETIMAAPEFPQPMYAPLRDLSAAYLLPGVELVPRDSVGLLQANPRFIEGYMVGLNHEMARQLLWNDYPTDQRGSYFRQFWDVSAYVPQPGDPTDPDQLRERLKDIPPIHTWPKPTPLGEHPNPPAVFIPVTDKADAKVVLLVRGELFKRYPTAIVYAGKAKRAGGIRVLDETDERYPVFRGTLPNDITFLGFNLSQADARGGTQASPEGFFFIFQQQPTEPRFGLEPVENPSPVIHWSDLAWTNFGGGGAFQLPDLGLTTRAKTLKTSPWRLASQAFSFVTSGTTVPDFLAPGLTPARVSFIVDDLENPDDPANGWGVNSAQTACILLRLPFRILIHADLMLPSS